MQFNKSPSIIDKNGYVVQLFDDIIEIFEYLHSNNILIFTASRTCTPKTAQKMLKLYNIDKYITASEWGTGSKKSHITQLLSKYQEIDFSDVCLFDDEWRNIDVEQINVTFCYLPKEELNWNEFWRGLQRWHDKDQVES